MTALRCARCNRSLRNPGTDVVIGGTVFVFGPVCAARFAGKRKKAPDPLYRRARVKRVNQPDLFAEAGL